MIKFEFLNIKDADQVAKLKSFAKEFDHEVENFSFPIYILKENEEWLGYFQIVEKPVIFTAWNPHKIKPRQFRDGMLAIWGWGRLQHGTVMTSVPIGVKRFTEKIFKKLGLRKTGLELYETE